MTNRECLVKEAFLKTILSVSNKITGVESFLVQIICTKIKVKNLTYNIMQKHYRIVALSHSIILIILYFHYNNSRA